MRRLHWLYGLLIIGLASPALAADGATIASQGNGDGALACVSCHGADGGGMPSAGFPRLAGLNAAYIIHQLESFADGSRDNAVMKPIAKALSETDRQAVATYYSQLPIPESALKATDQSDNTLGRQLALHGKWRANQVPGCVQCHGPGGVGVGEHFPPLAGQSATYISNQLHAWQDGSRTNDPLDLMKHVADNLTDEEIAAVAEWFAGQPATLQGGAK